MSAPLWLSIVVPTRDTRGLTLTCLESLERASRPDQTEFIVVDDGSADGTSDAVRRQFPSARVLRHESSSGFSAAVNAGLRSSTGGVLLLLNSDTEVDAGGLRVMLNSFVADARLGIVGAQLRYPDGRRQWSGGSAPGIAWLFAQAGSVHVPLAHLPGYRSVRPLAAARDRDVDWVTGAALAMRREVWDAIGPFDEGFRLYAQDLDFCLRARSAGWRVQILSSFGVMHHHGATIKGLEGTGGRENTGLMWRDLLYWARKQRGAAFARRAKRAIICGAWLRLCARRMMSPFVHPTQRFAWRARTNALRDAVAALAARGDSL